MTPNTHNISPPTGPSNPPAPQSSPSPPLQLGGFLSPSRHRSITYPTNPTARPPRQKRRAFPIPSPPSPLIFKWRCCQPWCDNSPPPPNTVQINANTTNTTHTTTHFKWVNTCVGLEGYMANIWQPGYREEECSRCFHKACSDCVLVNVEGWTEWRGELDEPATGRGIWARLGIWDAEESGLGLRVDDKEPPLSLSLQRTPWGGAPERK